MDLQVRNQEQVSVTRHSKTQTQQNLQIWVKNMMSQMEIPHDLMERLGCSQNTYIP